MNRLLNSCSRAILGLAMFAVMILSQANAQFTFTVTNLNDTGPGSLREALSFSNNADTIRFSVTGTISLASALYCNKAITIIGPGSALLTLSGSNATRIWDINTVGTLRMKGMRFANAYVNPSTGETMGGGMKATISQFYMEDIVFYNNRIGSYNSNGLPNTKGGGAYISGAYLDMDSVTFTQNTSEGRPSAWAGGAYIQCTQVNIDRSTFSQNSCRTDEYVGSSSAHAGGVYIDGDNVTIENTDIQSNTAFAESGWQTYNAGYTYGGGLYTENTSPSTNTLTMRNVDLSGNYANSYGNYSYPSGGGWYGKNHHIVVENSEFYSNQIVMYDWYDGSGFGYCTYFNTVSSVQIKNSIIRDHAANRDGYDQYVCYLKANGSVTLDNVKCHTNDIKDGYSEGIVYLDGSSGTIVNTEFYNNNTYSTGILSSIASDLSGTLTVNKSSIYGSKRGITLLTGNLNMVNSTMTTNTQDVYSNNSGSIATFTNSTLTGTITVPNMTYQNTILNAPVLTGTITSTGGNIINSPSYTASFTQGTDRNNVNPAFGTFDYHGGLTKVYAVQAFSQAVNNGVANGQTRDQRNYIRVGNVDIGAYEYNGTPPGLCNTSSTQTVSACNSYTWINSVTYTSSNNTATHIIPNSSNCDSVITLNLTINTTPAQPGTIAGNSTICSGSTNTYSITAVPGATSYTWNFPSGWSGSSTTNSISATAGATSGNITVTANNACGSSVVRTFAVTVSPTPAQPGSISGSNTICSGSTNTYSVTAVPGATSYTWTFPSGWSGSSTTNSISTTAGSTGGNITVVANNACGSSAVQTLAVTVSAGPTQPGTISGNTTICSGSTNTYSIVAVPGATSYTWTYPGGWSGSSTTNSISATSSGSSGNITVIANNACGSSVSQTLPVTVNVAPVQPGSISGNNTICSGTVNTYSIAAVPGATSYTWTYPVGWTGSSTTNSISATAGTTSGNITVTANNACGSSTVQTFSVVVNPTPAQPGSISGSNTICSGSTNTYSVTAVPGATSYTWTFPSGWSGSSTTNSISTTAGSTGGNITVVANNACGSSVVQTLAVTVSAGPSQPGTISGNATICSGSTNTYSIVAVPGATSYTWTYPGGWSGSSTTNSISATSSGSSGNITVIANNACGSSVAQTLPVTVNVAPVQPGSISGNNTICTGTVNTYSIAAVPGATSYTWTYPVGWSGSSTTNSISATAGATSGNITVTANNACGSSTVQTFSVVVNPTPAQPGSISGSNTICSGSTNTYSVTAVPGATSYTWTFPSGWSGSSTTNSISTTAGSTGGNITVVANNACGSSVVQTLAVTVSAGPTQPGTISGNTTICSGSTNTYSIVAVPGATSYTWTYPSGWSGSSTTNSISATSSGSSGNITVIANNACGSSVAQTLPVTVNVAPVQPGSISGNNTICSGTVNTYSIAAVPGATSYTWTYPVGWSGSSTTNSISATAGSTSGNITVTANNACGSSTVQTFSVVVNAPLAQPGSISGSNTICSGSTNTYSVTAVPGATSYTWTFPSGWSGSSTTNSISTTAGSTGGNITVVANNACGSSAVQTLSVTVNAGPTQPGTISGNTTICSGSTNTYSIVAVPGATSYTWTYPSGWSGSSTTNSISATSSGSSGNITVIANNACGSSVAQTLPVTVNQAPSQPGSISGNNTVCSGSVNTYSITAVPGATSYTWTYPVGWSGSNGTNSISVTASATSGNITVIANNACGSSVAQIFPVVVSALPVQPGTISGNISVCEGSANAYSVAPVPGATSYTWTLPAVWTGSSTTNNIVATASVFSGVIYVSANNACGTSAVQSLLVNVNQLPAQPLGISGNTTVCEGSSNTYSIPAVTGATSYTWTFPSGWSGTSITNSIVTTASATSGNISVVATNACGNSTPQSLLVTVSPDPIAAFSSTSNLLVVSFSDLSIGATSWLWNFGDLNTNGSQNPTHTYATPGTYNVCLTATANGCSNTTCQPVSVVAVGVENAFELQVSVTPNPSTGIFRLDCEENLQGKIFDAQGRLVSEATYEPGMHTIDLTSVTEGVYMLKLNTESSFRWVKLLKIR